MQETSMERRHLDFQDLDAVSTEVERLQRVGYTKVGNWDLGQCCEHLAKSMKSSVDGFQSRAPWLLRVFVAPIFKRRMFKTRKMPAGIKGPAELMPAAQVDETTALKFFDEQLGRLRNTTSFQKHAFFGKLTRDEWIELHLIHSSLHLSFLLPRDGQP
jgi:Protein of unknown function (DUF1569)